MSTIYLGTIDGGGDGKELLIAAINAELGTNYLIADFDFGEPSPVTVVAPTHNTMIKFGPKMSAGYYGVRTVYYNRIHASELGRVIVPYTGQTMVSQLLPSINERYGVYIVPADIIDKPVPPPTTSNQVMVDLEFAPTCIVFYSSTMIQVGQNDPTGDTLPTLPFENAATIGFTVDRDVNPRFYTPTSLAFGTDNVRVRASAIMAQINHNNGSANARLTTSDIGDNSELRYPFVGQWRHAANNKARGITVQGEVYELSDDGYDWVYLNRGNLPPLTGAITGPNGYYSATDVVKAVVQAPTGEVYILAWPDSTVGAPDIYRIDSVDGTWTKQNFVSTRMMSLKATVWDDLSIMDMLFCNGRVWLLINASSTYDIHPTKGINPPSVEMFNIASKNTGYWPIADITMRYSGDEVMWFTMKLVTPPPNGTGVDVIAAGSTYSGKIVPIMYRYQAVGEYVGYVLPTSSNLCDNWAWNNEIQVAAYQVPLQQVPATFNGLVASGQYLDVVQFMTPKTVAKPNRYTTSSGLRTENEFLDYGMTVLTSVATRQGRTDWFETSLSLAGNFTPQFITLQSKDGRQHVIFQNAVALHRLAFQQTVDTLNFTAILNSQAKIDDIGVATLPNPQGSCIYTRPGITEFTTPTAVLRPSQDTEASLPPIGYSFIAKTSTGAEAWYVAQSATELLVPRVNSNNYRYMGQVPAVVMAEGDRIVQISRNGMGSYVSRNTGASWQIHAGVAAMTMVMRWNDGGFFNGRWLIGSGELNLTSANFGEGVYSGASYIIDMKSPGAFKYYSPTDSSDSVELANPNNTLLMISEGYNNSYRDVQDNPSELLRYCFSGIDIMSPARVIAWDTDALLNYETLGQWTDASNIPTAVPYSEDYGVDYYMYNTPGRLVDFSRDVKYLGYNHWILTEDNNVWTLGFTEGVVPSLKFGLFGTVGSPYSTFLPEVNFHLWEYLDEVASYVPYVFYGGGKVLLLERLKTDNTFDVTQHLVSVPGDNGQPLVPVKMYTANRRDYWFAQKGNGIFKIAYAYNGVTQVSTVSFVRVFNLNTVQLRELEVQSGCITGIDARNAPLETLLPDNLPNGYFIGQNCRGTTMVKRFADGNGGYYEEELPNNVDCGFVAARGVMPNTIVAGDETEGT